MVHVPSKARYAPCLCLGLSLVTSHSLAQAPAEVASASSPAEESGEPPPRPISLGPKAEQTDHAVVSAETNAQSASETEARSIEAAPGDPWGDPQDAGLISLRALFQTRYTTTLASESQSSRESYRVRENYLATQGDGWEIKRALVRVSSEPSRYVGFKMVLDFAELIGNNPEAMAKQAYVQVRPIPTRLEFMVGLFKIPFSIQELDPSSRYEFASMGPTNRLLGDVGFAGRDLGAQVLIAPLRKPKRLRLFFGAFRGHAYDEHALPAGALASRIETEPSKSLRFGAGIVEHLRSTTYNRPFNTSGKDEIPNPPDPLYPTQKRWDRGRAWGVDARIKKKGFMARGECLYGERLDVDKRYGAGSFWSAFGILAYRIDAGSVRFIPALRAEWLDSDREHDRGTFRTLSFALSALFLERLRLTADVTRTDVERGTVILNQPKPLQQQPYLALDNTRIVVQMQLEL